MNNTKQMKRMETVVKIDDAVSDLFDVLDFSKYINEDDKSLLESVIYDLNRLSERLEEEEINNKKRKE